ncbi:MAG: F0F1 ATP synthase subunit delta [Sediminimonas sp.]|uniref:F0F1 ATP synthase subunit delta n=1 Tax=Sediminimonas sp. TaxID=2823379 RepID=UPI00286FC0BD|nr:F0F1 ATP synthase subunit delta [Sediminimonas sp.]MDR9486080.1 F0F1 ATP synthase subunit delta [Sediminimonas sp.]
MSIDWLTVAAQIVNFLVLVWLLQRFLYQPISEAMRRREARIEDRLSEAKAAREDAEDEARRLREERAALDQERQGILEQARDEAAELRRDLNAELREEMESKRAAWQRQLEEERGDFARRLQRRAGQQVLHITERVLADFAGSDLSERIAETFLSRLKTLDAATRDRLAEAAAEAESAVVTTGHPIAPATRTKITRALREAIRQDIPVNYKDDEAGLLGARLIIGEQTVEWSAARHLKQLGVALDEILDTEGHRAPATEKADGGDAGDQETEAEGSAT